MLTLNDGTRVDLDEGKAGRLAGQGTVSITKSANGVLTYNFIDQGKSTKNNSGLMNEISTPNGNLRFYSLNRFVAVAGLMF